MVGASAGGVETLSRLVRGLSPDLPASLFVVLHVSDRAPSNLPSILSHAGALRAEHVHAPRSIERGRIYVAPPDLHLNVAKGRVFPRMGPKENGHRPAIDPLFRSAARAYGTRVVGILLSGSGDDGSAGFRVIKQHQGTVFVQDPEETLHPQMARNALAAVDVDGVVRMEDLPSMLETIARSGTGPPDSTREEAAMEGEKEVSVVTCPDCGGMLWEVRNGALVRYECHVGHRYSSDSLADAHDSAIESALWTAVRLLNERVELGRRMGRQLRRKGLETLADTFEKRGMEAEESARLIRSNLLHDASEDVSPPASGGVPPLNEPAEGAAREED